MEAKLCVTFFRKGAKDNAETGENIECTQVMNMSDEAYEYMTSKEYPEWSRRSEWNKLTKTQRLIKHLDRIKVDLKATKFTYEVFPD